MSVSKKHSIARPLKTSVLNALAAAKIARVEILYDDECARGQVNDISAYDVHGTWSAGDLKTPSRIRPVPGQKPFSSLDEAVGALAWELLDHYHEGFWDGEGGYGSITIDVVKKSIRLDHRDRVIKSSSTTEV